MLLSRRLFLGLISGAAASPALAQAPLTSIRPLPRVAVVGRTTQRPIGDLIAEARLGGKLAFAVADTATGVLSETHNPVLGLPPASVAKAITALYALDRLGPDHRFQTRLVATGPVENGRLKGDLILRGGGDPTLDTDGLADMARQLKQGGLREITGRLLVDDSALPRVTAIDPEQPEHVSYNPSVSGLNLNYNRVHFEWKRQGGNYALTMDARAERFSPTVEIARMRVVDRALPVYTYADKGGIDDWTVARTALGSGGSRWLPVRRPEIYAGEVFRSLAQSYGIVLPKPAQGGGGSAGTALVTRDSPPLTEILREMLLYSTNLTAEAVGMAATAAGRGNATSLAVSAATMTAWTKQALGMSRARFVDHSGLGGASRVSPGDMVSALVRAGAGGALHGLMKKIPLRDAKGKPIPNHPVKVRAKTGTLNFVSALAGYVTAEDGHVLAFAIFAADLESRKQITDEDGEIPAGTRAWKARARQLQQDLIERWGQSSSG